MKFRIIAILCAALLISGCGTIRRTFFSTIPEPQAPEAEQLQVHNAEVVQIGEAAPQPPTPRRQVRTAPPQPLPIVRPEIRFSDAETQHVRLASINYFPTGGIDLAFDELAAEFCYPLHGNLISDFGMRRGRRHMGIDIKAMPGDTIRAAFPGVVRMSKNYSSYGNIVVIRHYQGFETVYSHNSRNLVKPNDIVEAGDPIALAGRTGRATTEHLHFEVCVGGTAIDPKLVVDPDGMTLRTGRLFVRNHNGIITASATESGALQIAEDVTEAKSDYDSARAQALAASTVDGKPKGSAEPEPVYYRVKKGDTLSAIAVRNGTTVSKLCSLNGIRSTSLLQIGQRLRVK